MPSIRWFCAWEKMGFAASKHTRELDTLIESPRLNEHKDFLISTIRCHINACRGRYAIEDNYQEVFRPNKSKSAQNFLMNWNKHNELFIACCYDCLLKVELFKSTVIFHVLFTVCSMSYGLKIMPTPQNCS